MKNTNESIESAIRRATAAGGKSYDLEKQGDTRPIEFFFQESHEGLVLFIIFYTQACRWSSCTACNLPKTSSITHVPYHSIMRQIDDIFREPDVIRQADKIRKVIVSNQGSVLDERTFSSTALMYLVAKINLHVSNLRTLCLETRPEYVDRAELEFLRRDIREANSPEANIELAIGFEAFDNHIRNDIFKKGLTHRKFEELVKMVAAYKFRLKCYFMQKPVLGMSSGEAIADVHRAINFLSRLAKENDVAINMHLNPTYAAIGTPLGDAFLKHKYNPPRLIDVARAVVHAKGKPISVYIGLDDEDMAVPGGSFIRDGDEKLVRELGRFNITQDYEILENLLE